MNVKARACQLTHITQVVGRPLNFRGFDFIALMTGALDFFGGKVHSGSLNSKGFVLFKYLFVN